MQGGNVITGLDGGEEDPYANPASIRQREDSSNPSLNPSPPPIPSRHRDHHRRRQHQRNHDSLSTESLSILAAAVADVYSTVKRSNPSSPSGHRRKRKSQLDDVSSKEIRLSHVGDYDMTSGVEKENFEPHRQSISTSTADPYVKPYAFLPLDAAPTIFPLGQQRRASLKINVQKIGIYGWRKRFLYFIVFILSLLAVVNGCLLYYLWRLLRVSFSEGTVGGLRFVSEDTLIINGRTFVLNDLYASSIKASGLSPLRMTSPGSNVSISSSSGENIFILNHQVAEVKSRRLKIASKGKVLFSVNDDGKVSIRQDSLRVKGNVCTIV